MAPLRVLIVGAGIGGPALAFWLSRQGHHCTIIERHPHLRASGQQLDLRAQGVAAVQRMGLLDKVRAAGVDEPGVSMVDKTGKEHARFMGSKTGTGKQGFSSEFEIMRGNLVNVLCDAAKEGESGKNVKFVFNMTVEEISQDEGDREGSVRVRFSDGSDGVYDMVVGADGQGSRTRRAMLGLERGQEDPTLSPLGVSMAFFTIPRVRTDTTMARGQVATEGRFVLTRGADSDRTIQVYYMLASTNPRAPELEAAMQKHRHDVQAQRDLWADVFEGASFDTTRITEGLRHSEEAGDFYTYRALKVSCPTWSRGRVALLGDAVASLGPNGLGTSTAIIGAYVVAGEIAKRTAPEKEGGRVDVQGALEAYESIMRPVMEKMPQMRLPSLLPTTERGIAFMLWIMSWVAFLRIDKLAMMFHSGNVADGWKLPAYPELKGGEPLKQ